MPAINPITDGRMMPPAPLATDIRPTAVPELPSEFDAARALIVHQVGPYEKPTSPLTMTADEGLFTNVSSAMKIAADAKHILSDLTALYSTKLNRSLEMAMPTQNAESFSLAYLCFSVR